MNIAGNGVEVCFDSNHLLQETPKHLLPKQEISLQLYIFLIMTDEVKNTGGREQGIIKWNEVMEHVLDDLDLDIEHTQNGSIRINNRDFFLRSHKELFPCLNFQISLGETTEFRALSSFEEIAIDKALQSNGYSTGFLPNNTILS